MLDLNLEANRCLVCKNARCKSACPISTDIPTVINLYKEGKIKEAGEILFNNNPLSAVCAIVCPHEDQCAGNCIRGIKGEPIQFYKIEEEISKKYLKDADFSNVPKNGKNIAIVGSGPAGLTVAFELAKKGYSVTVFEKNEQLGGILRYGIPEFRLPREIIDNLISILKNMGVKFKINATVGPILTLDKLFQDGYDSVFIGTGVWNPRRLDIKGESLGHVHYAIDYLRSPKNYDLGDNVVVIGAGNVAMDASRSAKHYDSKNVYVAYRRDFDSMTATKAEIHEAIEEGVDFMTYKAPIEIVNDGIILADTKKIVNEEGKTSLVTVEGSEKLFKCDSVLVAVSQVPRNTIVSNNKGLEVNNTGLIMTDNSGHTTRDGVFACGDVTHGAKTVIEAVVASKIVAASIDEYLK
ncbi:NAD(P)-dependent oxidoreductase [Paraclostridium ghonii]|uniref:Glutamate synthase (NADPH/NADH) small chain n=1 Tax=Paraclostridium ghonii TaxID=29358 RepID=A0ABU0MXJ7_9FIRM|nr:NAD(P)-dependent oxidoreductase [Paeniclostridium ghonii]MDQ0555246.1 glutamate synthase (NADPH/NADH) small chain [Paeniclostridium ghonii]